MKQNEVAYLSRGGQVAATYIASRGFVMAARSSNYNHRVTLNDQWGLYCMRPVAILNLHSSIIQSVYVCIYTKSAYFVYYVLS